MKAEDLKQDQQLYFVGEKAPFKIAAINDNYAIATRKLHKRHDAELLRHQVEMGGYFTFTEAYDHQKDNMVYSILDFKNNKRGTHNLVFNPYDFEDIDSMDKLLNDLEFGEVELSRRNFCELQIQK